jgi:hypothetical protein
VAKAKAKGARIESCGSIPQVLIVVVVVVVVVVVTNLSLSLSQGQRRCKYSACFHANVFPLQTKCRGRLERGERGGGRQWRANVRLIAGC